MKIYINNVHEAEMLRKMLHKINDHGIDKTFQVIKDSIERKDTSDFYLISPHTVEIDEKDIEEYHKNMSAYPYLNERR